MLESIRTGGTAFLLAAACSVALPAAAATFVIGGDPADISIQDNGGMLWVGESELHVGNSGQDMSAVMVFQLPELAGEVVTNAVLSFRAKDNMWDGTVNADLYGVRHAIVPTVLPADRYTGAFDTNATFIQNNLLDPTLAPGDGFSTNFTNVVISGAAAVTLGDWVQEQYHDGATAGDYIFLRLSADASPPPFLRYFVASANHTNEAKPSLVIDTMLPAATNVSTNVTSAANDQTVFSNGLVDFDGEEELRAGRDTVITSSAILVFPLPDLGGEPVVGAELSIAALDNMWNGTANADLYGVRSSVNPGATGADHYTGPLDPTAVLLQDNLLDPELTPGPGGSPAWSVVHTSIPGGEALAAWIQSLYDGGATTGTFAFIRLSPDADPGSNFYRYKIAATDHTNQPAPSLTLKTPFPGSTTYTIHSVLVGDGAASPTGDIQVASGGATQVVFTAATWHEISSFLTDGVAVPAAQARPVYTADFVNVSARVSNHVTFAVTVADADGKTPATWYGPLGADPAQSDQDADGLTLYGEYLINSDPTISNLFKVIESGMDGSGRPFIRWNGLELPNGTVVIDAIPDLKNGAWNPLGGTAVHHAGVTTWTADNPAAADVQSTRVRVQE